MNAENNQATQRQEGNPQKALETAHKMAQHIRQRLNAVIVGQEKVIDETLCVLMARGHVLLEGVPGTGKTLIVRSLAKIFNGKFNRIQFTPDLMPSDVTGSHWFNQPMNRFELREGPVFTNLLLADEINRAPAKTQAALLEVMQEGSVTLDGETRKMEEPFMVLATQNPIEQEGTYPLPEAQLDRFMFKILIDYPSQEDEFKLLGKINSAEDYNLLKGEEAGSLDVKHIIQMQKTVGLVTIDSSILDYIVKLVGRTRNHPGLAVGAGPRASIALVASSKAWAMIQGRAFVIPDDVKSVFHPVMRHRVRIATEMEMEGVQVDEILHQIINQITAPRK